ncbi:MAG: hypothetical protein ACYTG0_46005, partial [Planctomycetota bacterium]
EPLWKHLDAVSFSSEARRHEPAPDSIGEQYGGRSDRATRRFGRPCDASLTASPRAGTILLLGGITIMKHTILMGPARRSDRPANRR